MIDITNKIANEIGPMGIENYIIPQQENTAFGKKTEEALEVGESVSIKSVVYQKPTEEKDNTFSDMLKDQSELDAKSRKDQMVVLSNTVSPEDYQKLKQDGFSLSDSTGQTIITETDQIKAALARAGVDISIYGGDLSADEIKEIAGNAAVARQIQNSMEAADIPYTSENALDAKEAMEQAVAIGQLSEDAIAYLLKNNLSPTIENLYKAQFSSQKMISANQKNIDAVLDKDFEGMKGQIEDIIKKAGEKVDNKAFSNCRWLISNGIPMTSENLKYLASLQEFSIDKEGVVDAMTQSILDGGRPKDGMLISGYSPLDRAREAESVINDASPLDLQYCIEKGQEITVSSLREAKQIRDIQQPIEKTDTMLKAQRQLAEVRLAMTVEANYALIKRGISIDTKPLEQLVELLKQQEQQYYKDSLAGAGIETSSENVATLKDTTTALEQMKSYPAYAMKLTSAEEPLGVLHREGAALKDTFDKANQRYETMMTSPRADMGDSISKAFRNVDDILQDLNYEITKENQRAVRILAYNNTELIPENIDQIKAVDEEVQRAFKNLTPAVTLEMIRRGIQPLDMSINELNKVAEQIKSEIGDNDAERFNKYLWKLEQNHQITEEERSSYIGIYRLIAQVEKSDGAALGAVINQRSDMTMRNLLTAVRSHKKGTMEYKVDDDFAGVNGKVKGAKIDDQIMAAYSLNCVKDSMEMLTPEKVKVLAEKDWEAMTPEQLKDTLETVEESEETQKTQEALELEYAKEELQQFEQAVETSTDIYRIMERYDISNTLGNIIATNALIKNPNEMFRRIQMVREIKDIVLERFGEAIKTPSELAAAQEELAEVATHAMDGMIMEEKNPKSIDVKAIKQACNQFRIAAQRAKSESYVIPVETSDGVVTGISLKIVRGDDKKGLVDIIFDTEGMGKVAASFEAKEDGVSGTIATSDSETRALLADNLQLLMQNMNEEGQESLDVRVAHIPDISMEQFEVASLRRESSTQLDTESEGYRVQTARLYNIAESFINTIKDLVSF